MAKFDIDIEIDGQPLTITLEAPNRDMAVGALNQQTSTEQGMNELRQMAQEQTRPGQPNMALRRKVSSFIRPTLEMGGGMTGAIIGGGGSLITGRPAVAGVGMLTGGALGVAGGKSAADVIDRMLGIKEPINSLQQALLEGPKNILEGAQIEAANLLMGPVLAGAGKMTRGGIRKLLSALFGPSERAISARFRRPGDIRGARPIEELADELPEVMNKISKEVTELDRAAWDQLLKLKAEPRSEVLRILKEVRREIKIEGGQTVGQAQKKALATIDGLISDVNKIRQKGVPKEVDPMLDQRQLRKIIQATDENIDWNNTTASRANEALIEFRAKLNQRLRSNNPEFANVMDPLAERMSILNDVSKSFSVGRESGVFALKGDTTPSRLTLATREGRQISRRRLDNLKRISGRDFLKDTRDTLMAKEFQGGKTQGSRGVRLFSNLAGIAGAGTGAAFGGPFGAMVGGGVGSGVGNLLGAIVDKRGGNIAGRLVDSLSAAARSGIPQRLSGVLNDPNIRRAILIEANRRVRGGG